MTHQSIISTKINIPQVRADVVIRPRIMDILSEGLTRPSALTLISAPAGYGKTTLLVSWLRKADHQFAWLSLEPDDDSFPRFVTYLVASLQKVSLSFGQNVGKNFDVSEDGSTHIDSIISNLLMDVSEITQPAFLILEDYHCIQSPLIHKLVEGMVEHIHPQLRLILLTRQDPPLPLSRWRARNQLIEIRTNDLQFTLDETTEFLKRVMKLELSNHDISFLEKKTEGWVAGLQLAALSIRNRKKFSWKIDSNHRDIADYLIFEVFGQLSAEQRDFLLQTSIVSRLNASLCNALAGRNDSQAMLERLEADNLFIVSLDESREWFRYHHLFGEFLRKRLSEEYSEGRICDLHLLASHWLTDNKYVQEAIDHALAAKDYEYAAGLIAPQSGQWIRRGEISTILKYLNQLPRDIVWNHWGLCLWYGWSCAVTGDLNSAERWTDRLETLIRLRTQEITLQENGPMPLELHNVYVQVLAIRSVIARHNRDYVSAVALGEQALRLVPEKSLNLRSIVSALLSTATLEAGHFDHTETILHSARQVTYQAENPYITFILLLNESALAALRGQLQRAHNLNIEALRLAQAESMERLAFLVQFRLGRIHYFWNQLAPARQYITTAIEHANRAEYPANTIQGYITLAWIQNAEGYLSQALKTLDDAEELAINHHEPESAERVRGVRAQIQLSAGEYEEARHWLKASGWELFDSARPGSNFNDESFFPFCQLLIASQDPSKWKRVKRLLDWRLMDLNQQLRENTILKIRLMQALLYQAQNHADRAMALLIQALQLAMPEDIIRPFLDEGQQLIPLLRRVPQGHAARKFSRKILADASQLDRTRGLVEPLSEQEITILQLMARGHTNPEIAHRLMLAVSTVRWYAKQIYRKLGVHNRTQAATQAREIDLL